ncbi:serine/threonine-protein kinase Nek2-like [Thalassophryne amazonica]|uniref:serine/threonine-protein kinase Nek2-like n=1 Tax=Thalassophryne amazonica TaxID=390379 RepID=UPI0014711067|nr:serine/threonine-protein kinase Nek2-like [Thalassophryne amazonica]
MSTRQHDRLLQEVVLLKKFNHPNIVQCYDQFLNKNKKEVYIVMEYCESGDLSRLIEHAIKKGKSIKEEFILQVLVQLASALKHCHRRPDGSVVLHQDLKPANVFLHKNLTVKLGDFGLAEILPMKNDCAQSKAGTPLYMSPVSHFSFLFLFELPSCEGKHQRKKTNGKVYNGKSDIWSLGCLIYYLCALKHPFRDGGGKKFSDRINSGKYKRIPSCYSDKLDSLIRDMLRICEDSRPSAEDILSRCLQTEKATEEKRSHSPDHPLPPPMPPADVRPKEEELQKPPNRKRKLESGHSQKSKRRRKDPAHRNNTIVKFADDTTVVGLFSKGDEAAYREEVQRLRTCECVERIHTFRVQGVQISDDLSWTDNTSAVIKKTQQSLHILKILRKNNLYRKLLLAFYQSSTESLLTYCVLVRKQH